MTQHFAYTLLFSYWEQEKIYVRVNDVHMICHENLLSHLDKVGGKIFAPQIFT